MLFAIGAILVVAGFAGGMILGTGSNPYIPANNWDAVGGGAVLLGAALMLSSVCMLAWRYLP